MKKYLIILLLIVSGASAHSQFITTLTVNQPSATFTEWYNNSTFIYVVEFQSIVGSRQVVIKAELKTSDGTLVATTDLSKAQVFTLQGGTRIFYAKDILPLEIISLTNSYKNTLERTGKLPAGTYQLDVQLVEPGQFMPLTPVRSRIFNLAAPQLPYLIMPLNNDTLNVKRSENAIIFRWTPLIPQQQSQPYYRLQVFEVYPYQQPLQALRGNQPLLNQLLRSQTQFIWRPQMSFSVDSSSRRFIWTVQTLNANQQPYIQTDGNGESRSEPFMFIIGER